MSTSERALSLKRSEVKNTRTARRYVCGGSAAHKDAVRGFNRAQRQHGKTLCQEDLEEVMDFDTGEILPTWDDLPQEGR